jgi:hypothetical protein
VCGNSSYLTATRTLVESSSAIAAAAAAVIFGCKDDWLTHDDDDLQNQENTCTPQGFDSSSCKRHRRYAKKNYHFFSLSSVTDELLFKTLKGYSNIEYDFTMCHGTTAPTVWSYQINKKLKHSSCEIYLG